MQSAWSATAGRYDPTTLPVLVANGYDRSIEDPSRVTILPQSTFDRGQMDAIDVDEAASVVTLPEGTVLDPGGIGKGLAADLGVTLLLDKGAHGASVAIGGDVAMGGDPPAANGWQVTVEHPDDASRRRVHHRGDLGRRRDVEHPFADVGVRRSPTPSRDRSRGGPRGRHGSRRSHRDRRARVVGRGPRHRRVARRIDEVRRLPRTSRTFRHRGRQRRNRAGDRGPRRRPRPGGHRVNPQFWWYVARASGIVAWLMLTASVLCGIVLVDPSLPADAPPGLAPRSPPLARRPDPFVRRDSHRCARRRQLHDVRPGRRDHPVRVRLATRARRTRCRQHVAPRRGAADIARDAPAATTFLAGGAPLELRHICPRALHGAFAGTDRNAHCSSSLPRCASRSSSGRPDTAGSTVTNRIDPSRSQCAPDTHRAGPAYRGAHTACDLVRVRRGLPVRHSRARTPRQPVTGTDEPSRGARPA